MRLSSPSLQRVLRFLPRLHQLGISRTSSVCTSSAPCKKMKGKTAFLLIALLGVSQLLTVTRCEDGKVCLHFSARCFYCLYLFRESVSCVLCLANNLGPCDPCEMRLIAFGNCINRNVFGGFLALKRRSQLQGLSTTLQLLRVLQMRMQKRLTVTTRVMMMMTTTTTRKTMMIPRSRKRMAY